MDPLTTNQDSISGKKPIIQQTEHSKVGVTWMSLGAFMLILLLLAIFILQNSTSVQIKYLGFHGNLPFGVGMLLAVVAGSILALLIGSVRILQLKSRARRSMPN